MEYDMVAQAGPINVKRIESGYEELIRQFPALYQIVISQNGEKVFERTHQEAQEGTASILFRSMVRSWAGLFSSAPETFQHRAAGRSNIRSAAKSIVGLLTGIALNQFIANQLLDAVGE